MATFDAEQVERFWAKVEKTPTCWLWIGAVGEDGYGQFWDGRRARRAHRYSYELAYGEIPDGTEVLMHLCDNRICVFPPHLQPGTHEENMRDRDEKGRTLAGQRHGSSKLKQVDVDTIRYLSAKGVSQTDLANRFNVSTRTVAHILKGTTWKRKEK